MRAFLAFELPDDVRRELAALTERFRNVQPRGVNWVRPENLHITLLFLGEAPASLLGRLDDAFGAVLAEQEPFEVHTPRVQIVPPNEPRTLWTRYDTDNRRALSLPGRLKDALADLPVEPDMKALKLHVTLGRIKTKIDERTLASMMGQSLGTRSFTISEVSLYESRLTPAGPDYTRLCAYTLTRRTSE